MQSDAEKIARIAERLTRDRARARKRLAVRIDEAHGEARRLASAFTAECGVQQVILFGSLAEGRVRSESFDIDLAVSGGDLIECILLSEKSSFKVDVVDLKLLPESTRRAIREHGVVLYGAE